MGKIQKNRTLSYDFRLNRAKKITEDFDLLPLRTELKRQDDFGVFSTRISYTWRRLVRFPIAPDKLPERDWLGAPLSKQNPEVERFSSYFPLWEIKSLDLNTSQNWKKKKKKYSQSYNEVLRGAGDHCPATRVHRVLIPIAEHAVRIIQCRLQIDQSLHCRKGISPKGQRHKLGNSQNGN